MPRKEAVGSTVSSAQAQQESVSDGIESYELPKSLVTRIARSAFPDNVKLQKEAMLALLKGSTVFVNYIAATAHDVAASKQHKSVSASDVLKALELTQFGDMVEKLQVELQAYRDLQKPDKSKKPNAKGKAKEVDDPSVSLSSAANTKGKQKAIIVIPGSRSASIQQPPPSSEPEPDDGDETEDDAAVTRAQSESGEDDLPEQDDDEAEEEDEEEEDEEPMDVEQLSHEGKILEGRTLESRDHDTEMDS